MKRKIGEHFFLEKYNDVFKDVSMLSGKKVKKQNECKEVCGFVEAVKETYLPLMKVESAW